eukprot:TRINITY_DN4130_c2_g1_i1.p1 TRINITY_DN4130_c2_g1~~TRINITY_DN4130_c2_g1_i1.p1  ORF type:complete len:929 (+),score=239.98 TRINITY_DN4130_c2_g1_i1:104-2890(+)
MPIVKKPSGGGGKSGPAAQGGAAARKSGSASGAASPAAQLALPAGSGAAVAGSWRARADEISKLCREQREPQHDQEDSLTPEDVLRHKKKQEILTGEGPRREAQGDGRGSQVFKQLELKAVPRVSKPKSGASAARGGDGASEDDDEEGGTAEQGPHISRKLRAAMAQRTARRARDTEKPVEIVIPLGNDRIKTRDILKDKALRSEYAARYLERLGVSPTPANLALIWKEIPLEDCRIQQVFHPGLSKHEKKNYIVIRPNQKNKRKGAGSGTLHDPQHIPFETLPDSLLGPPEDEGQPAGRAHSPGEPAAQHGGERQIDDDDHRGSRVRHFSEYKDSFLYPFNLRARYGTAQAAAAAAAAGAEGAAAATKPGGRRGQRRGQQQEGGDGEHDDGDSSGSEESASALLARLGSDRALTEQRLKLQDRLLAMVRKQQEEYSGSASPPAAAPGPAGGTPAPSEPAAGGGSTAGGAGAEGDSDEDEGEDQEQEETASQKLRAELERRAADGDLAALENHPDMDQADCVPLSGAPMPVHGHHHHHHHHHQHQRPAAPPTPHDTAAAAAARAAAAEHSKEQDAIRKEVAEGPPKLGDAQVRDLFARFISDFPFRRFWGAREARSAGRGIGGDDGGLGSTATQPPRRMDDELRTRCSRHLTQAVCVGFERILVNFLYWTFLAPLSSEHAARREALNPDAAFAEVYQRMLALLGARSSRSHYAVDLPIMLLGVRVVTEAIFTNCYPKWAAAAEGKYTLRRIDELITQLLDPMGYLSHISVVESSPQALRVLHRKRMPQRMPLAFTSPMIRFVVGEARSKEAKALLAGSSREQTHELFAMLTPTIRAKLLNIIAAYKMKVRPRSSASATGGRSREPSAAPHPSADLQSSAGMGAPEDPGGNMSSFAAAVSAQGSEPSPQAPQHMPRPPLAPAGGSPTAG